MNTKRHLGYVCNSGMFGMTLIGDACRGVGRVELLLLFWALGSGAESLWLWTAARVQAQRF
jgi:hypothetical protein